MEHLIWKTQDIAKLIFIFLKQSEAHPEIYRHDAL